MSQVLCGLQDLIEQVKLAELSGAGEILMAKFREEDVIDGKDVSGALTLKQTVDKLHKPTVPKANPNKSAGK